MEMEGEKSVSDRLDAFLDAMCGKSGRKIYQGTYPRKILAAFLAPLFNAESVNWNFFLEARKRSSSRTDRREKVSVEGKTHTILITPMLINALIKTFEREDVLSTAMDRGTYFLVYRNQEGLGDLPCLCLLAADPYKKKIYFRKEDEARSFLEAAIEVEGVENDDCIVMKPVQAGIAE